MFSFFKKSKPAPTPALQGDDSVRDDSNITLIDERRMTFDERKDWRVTVVKHAVNEVFLSFGLTGSMYRYRILPLDKRYHFFVVLVETTKHFALSKFAETSKLSMIETKLKSIIDISHGIIIDSVYWNANETIDVFEKASLKKLPAGKSKKTMDDLRKTFSDTLPGEAVEAIISEEEFNSFKDALKTGKKPNIGGKEYDTDLSPLSPQ